jgi:sirohydrochlorin ferrochelatase
MRQSAAGMAETLVQETGITAAPPAAAGVLAAARQGPWRAVVLAAMVRRGLSTKK